MNGNTTNILRNIAFGAASVIALEFIFWIYTGFLKFIVQAIVLNLSPIWTILIFFLLGGLIFGFIRMIGAGLSMLYMYICKIATHEKFVIVWTEIWVIAGVILNIFRLWSTSEFLLQGVMGIIGLVIVTVNLIFLAIMLIKATQTNISLFHTDAK